MLVFAAGFLLPLFFSATPTGSYAAQYVNAMADLPLAMLFGGVFCLYYAVGREKRTFWLTALPLAVLTLTKDICFAYGLIAAFLIGLDLLFAADGPVKKAFPKALLKAGGLAVVVLAAFLSWGRYTAAVTPTADTAASVGSEGLSYGAVLVGGVKQLLGIGRTEKFAQIMAAMGSAFFTRRICLLGGRRHCRGGYHDGGRSRLAGRRERAPPAAACLRRTWGLRSALRRCICST